MNPFDHYAALIGIDWADRKHDLCLRAFDSEKLEFSILTRSPESIQDGADDLRQRFDDQPTAICIKSCKVPLIHALLKYDFVLLFPVNPRHCVVIDGFCGQVTPKTIPAILSYCGT